MKSAADQQRWTAIHQVLIASLPSDPATPALIGLTRPVGSINGKTGRRVQTLKPGTPTAAAVLEEWAREVSAKPFEVIGGILFGQIRQKPCPYCQESDSHFDLGRVVGFCYGPCHQVPLTRLYEPFVKSQTETKSEEKGGEHTAT